MCVVLFFRGPRSFLSKITTTITFYYFYSIESKETKIKKFFFISSWKVFFPHRHRNWKVKLLITKLLVNKEGGEGLSGWMTIEVWPLRVLIETSSAWLSFHINPLPSIFNREEIFRRFHGFLYTFENIATQLYKLIYIFSCVFFKNVSSCIKKLISSDMRRGPRRRTCDTKVSRGINRKMFSVHFLGFAGIFTRKCSGEGKSKQTTTKHKWYSKSYSHDKWEM